MAELALSRPSLLQPLRGAQGRLEGDTLLLDVPADFAGFAGMHLDEYRDLATRAAGRAVKVRIGAAVAAEPAARPPEQSKRERLLEQASREPAVQEALDLFSGRIVDVRDVES